MAAPTLFCRPEKTLFFLETLMLRMKVKYKKTHSALILTVIVVQSLVNTADENLIRAFGCSPGRKANRQPTEAKLLVRFDEGGRYLIKYYYICR